MITKILAQCEISYIDTKISFAINNPVGITTVMIVELRIKDYRSICLPSTARIPSLTLGSARSFLEYFSQWTVLHRNQHPERKNFDIL